MRAYLAVIKDSFREAFASRVLWVLLLLITLTLFALSPLAVTNELGSTLKPNDITTGVKLVHELVDEGEAGGETPAAHIWGLLSGDLQNRMKELRNDGADKNLRRVLFPLTGELNDLLDREDFYNQAAWRKVAVGEEAKGFLESDPGSLSKMELRRRNRLLLDAAFLQHINPVQPTAHLVTYLGYPIGDPIPLEWEELQQLVKGLLVTVMSFFVGTLGVFVAILVTASIIPQMFEPGAIDLLLSRPVSRSLLFLSKFIGGCAFILLNAGYFILGLWLYAGLRFELWSGKLLLCIPVFLFLFAIYYSISALSGVIWKNAVVSVVMAILFWTACFLVGTSKGVLETMVLNERRLNMIVPAGESMIAANKGGETFEWNSTAKAWEPIFSAQRAQGAPFGFVYPMVGPIYDEQNDQLVAIESSNPTVPGFAGSGTIVVGKREEGWRRISGVSSAVGVQLLTIDNDGQILIVGPFGIHRFVGNVAIEHKPFKVLGVDLAAQGKAGRFVDVGPQDGPLWRLPLSAARNPANDQLAIYSRGQLTILEKDAEGKYSVIRDADLETEQPAVIAYAVSSIAVALADGEVRLFQADSLKERSRFQPFKDEKPRKMIASNDGRWFAALFHNRKAWVLDAETGKAVNWSVSGQGNVSEIAFTPENKLLVADRFPRLIEYNPETGVVLNRWETESDWTEWTYRFLVKPIYTVFPKPGELDNLVTYLLTEEKTESTDWDRQNLQSERVVLNIWEPIWSNLIFLTVVLGLTCVYIERKDF